MELFLLKKKKFFGAMENFSRAVAIRAVPNVRKSTTINMVRWVSLIEWKEGWVGCKSVAIYKMRLRGTPSLYTSWILISGDLLRNGCHIRKTHVTCSEIRRLPWSFLPSTLVGGKNFKFLPFSSLSLT